jgi:hypothetical protein
MKDTMCRKDERTIKLLGGWKDSAKPEIISKIMSTVLLMLVWDIARSRGRESSFVNALSAPALHLFAQ